MDLRQLNQFSLALFGDARIGEQKVLETFALMVTSPKSTIKDVLPHERHEKILIQLIYQADKMGRLFFESNLNSSFARLSSRERLVLVALETGQFSYAEMRSWLSLSPDAFEYMVWQARSRFVDEVPTQIFRAGTSPQCPANEGGVPWTQRYFDEELTRKQTWHTQEHLRGCSDCKASLIAAREFFFQVSKKLNEIVKLNPAINNGALREDLNQFVPKNLLSQNTAASSLFSKAIVAWFKKSSPWIVLYALVVSYLIMVAG